MYSADERRFARALCVSLAVHVLVLSHVKGVDRERRAGAGGALTVTLLRQARTADAGVEPPGGARVPAARDTGARVVPAPREVKLASPPPLPRPQTATVPLAGSAIRAVAPGNSGADAVRRSAEPGPGVVDVLLVIGADGRPSGIHWDRLPALTDDQLRQLEALIRRQVYPSMEGTRLTQAIDVFDLLAIARRSPEPSGVSPQ